MRVLMFGWELPPHNSGGLGVACYGIAKSLTKQGVEVIFVLPKKRNYKNGDFRTIFADNSGVTTRYIDSSLVPYITSEAYRRKFKHGGGMYGRDLFEEVERYAQLAAKVAMDEDFDVIHVHDWLSFGAGIAAKKVSGKPLIAHVHATEVDRTAGNVNQYIYEKEKEGVLAADKVLSVSQFTKDILINQYGVSPERVQVVHNGIDPENYSTHESPDRGLTALKEAGYKVVLFVGRITIMKGPDNFIRIAERVLEFNPKVIFVVAGSGDMEGQVMSMASGMGISKNVIFPGFMRGHALSALYKAADLFVMPSVSEPFGLVPLEAILHGTPVLVSKQSGVSEVLKHALKADFWDIEEMADKILSVTEHDSLRHTLTYNSLGEVARHTWDDVASTVAQIYRGVV